MAKKLSEKINQVDFQRKPFGYTVEEVDGYLDGVVTEVIKLEREIESLNEKLRASEGAKAVLEQKNKELSIELYNYKAHNGVTSTSSANFTNIELLNRISNLEKMVKSLYDQFNKK